MLTSDEIKLMTTRKNAAMSALKFFTDIKKIKSANNPFDRLSTAQKEHFYLHRNDRPNTVMDSFDNTALSGMGNCDEKGRICYAALRNHPLLWMSSFTTLCSSINYDHVYVIVADEKIYTAPVQLSALGSTAMVVDGWTQDWYFPNVNWAVAHYNSLGNIPNPRQLYVRNQIANHHIQNYGDLDLV